MSRIHLLDQDTINKIAAGEVVERPISVIKELIENAIDAKATAVTVEIEDGGLKLIRITDNGSGMSREDVKNAFLRHATSKIEDAGDLSAIGSLGFRGEALASIAAVSMVECMTKTKEDIAGIRYVMEGSVEKSFSDIGCPNGTTLVVRELFYNVPARKKFLKTPKTEGGYVSDLMHRMALSHPGISFKYIMNGKVKLHTSGNFALKDCIYQLFGKEYAKSSKKVDYEMGDLRITGYVGEPVLSRGNRQYEIYYVNGRYIKSKWIQKGIEEGTREAMMINQFPFAVLFLEMPLDKVDVNVHPNKMQVRFDDEQGIMMHFRQAVIDALHSREPVASVSLTEKEDKKIEKQILKEERRFIKDAPEPFEVSRRSKPAYQQAKPEFVKRDEPQPEDINALNRNPLRETEAFEKSANDAKPPVVQDTVEESDQAVEPVPKQENEEIKRPNAEQQKMEEANLDSFLDDQQIKKHRIIGQAFKTYWIVEYHNEMYIVDQHAAHEKVLYETWLNTIKGMDIPSQVLLEPLVYDLSDGEYDVFEAFRDDILKLGFDVEAFGGTTIIIKSVPYLLNMPLADMDFIYFSTSLWRVRLPSGGRNDIFTR